MPRGPAGASGQERGSRTVGGKLLAVLGQPHGASPGAERGRCSGWNELAARLWQRLVTFGDHEP
jgi:hypothetical protein